ncbi:MAG: serine/threonine protein kinase, partial [Planctomycetota bacterium]
PSGDAGIFVAGAIIDGRYRIIGRIGRGAMGEVYRADDLTLGQTVALKFLPRALAADAARRKRFHNEVRIARRVTHPNICRVYDIGEYEGHTYLSMEYIDGEDLASLLRRIGHLPKAKAIDVSRQICAGLAAAHAAGVLHRDLKPMNIMIDGRGKVRITDFGLAALVQELDDSDMRAGTPAYMSPEQLAGKDVSERSDVYSLGLVLYELFTGRRAYRASSATELARAQAERAPASPSSFQEDFDPAVERVIFHCLEHAPEHRPASALAVAAALPGGDPLSAALAAGELPSPELVAASTHAEGVAPNVGLACLLVILAGVVALPFLNDRLKLYSFVQMSKPPEVLRFAAQEILSSIGYTRRRPFTAHGFVVRDDVLDRIETESDDPTRWSRLVLEAPPAIEYWYRESPVPLTPRGASGMVSPRDPPLTEPGMTLVRLSPS